MSSEVKMWAYEERYRTEHVKTQVSRDGRVQTLSTVSGARVSWTSALVEESGMPCPPWCTRGNRERTIKRGLAVAEIWQTKSNPFTDQARVQWASPWPEAKIDRKSDGQLRSKYGQAGFASRDECRDEMEPLL
eukprot:1400637-Rhodomonas_salina.1